MDLCWRLAGYRTVDQSVVVHRTSGKGSVEACVLTVSIMMNGGICKRREPA